MYIGHAALPYRKMREDNMPHIKCSIEYPLETYKLIASKHGFDDIRSFEVYLLLHAYGYSFNDKLLYEISMKLFNKTKDSALKYIIDKYSARYQDHLKRGYSFYIDLDERGRLVKLIAKLMDDNTLFELFDKYKPEYYYRDLGVFRGSYYVYDGVKLKQGCGWDEVYRDAVKALKERKERAYYFLKAIIEIYKERPPDPLYYNAPRLAEIEKKIIEFIGRTLMLTPVDYVTLKAYRIYFKAGTRRNPTHAIPLESIPPIEKALEEWKK